MLKTLGIKLLITSFLVSLLACNNNEGQLDGTWVSSKSKTLEKVKNTMNLSDRHRSILGNMIGKMKHTIKDDKWESEHGGIITESNFKIQAIENDCYDVVINNIKNVRACLIEDELLLPSGIDNVLEVFIRSPD